MSLAQSLRSVCTGLACATLLQAFACAQESLADLPSYREGCQALVDERFETAIEQFLSTWETLLSSNSGDTEKDFVTSRLLRSFLKNGDSKTAVSWLRENPPREPSPETLYWTALSFQTEEHFSEAVAVYKKLVSELAPPPSEILLNFAICLANEGNVQQAYEITEQLPTSQETSRNLTQAHIASLAGKHQTALALANNVSSQTNLTPRQVDQIAKIRIHSLTEMKDLAGAASHAISLIEQSSSEIEGLEACLLLEDILTNPGANFDPAILNSVSKDKNHPAHESATLFSALLQNRGNQNLSQLESLRETITSPILIQELERRVATPVTSAIPSAETQASSRGLENRAFYETAKALYLKKDFQQATEVSLSQATRAEKSNHRIHLHNAAVSALRDDQIEQFEALRKELEEDSPESPLLSDLSYLSGLYFASKGNPQAFSLLTSFTKTNEDHPFFVDAQLALAEIHINQAPARPGEAREIFESLETRPLKIKQQERLDYIKVWADYTDREASTFATNAEKFLNDWPNSVYFSEVALILAKRYFETKKFALAKEQFHLISERFPDSDYAETARFFAAKSSPRNASTVSLWKQIIAEDGKTKQEARHELALLYLAMDDFSKARDELNSLLNEKALPKELMLATAADLGFSWYAEALANDKEAPLLEEAANAFAELASNPDATKFWRFNAAVRRGKCLESLGSESIALEIYRSIVNETSESNLLLTDVFSPEEMNWVFRAGFAAIEILKSQENWSAAIQVADSLATKEGARAFEAARLARSLRLKHWVWE